MTPRFIAHQLSHPRGFPGYLMGRLMNRSNARINTLALQELELQPSDRVLEIGFGGGVNLRALMAGAGFVAGFDRSSHMVNNANHRFSTAVEEDRAEFRQGSVEAMPYDAGYFTKICTIHTVYFWRNLTEAFSEIFRVIAPNGRVAVGFLPKRWMDRMKMADDVFTPRTPEEVAHALLKVGFRDVRTVLPKNPTRWNVILAER